MRLSSNVAALTVAVLLSAPVVGGVAFAQTSTSGETADVSQPITGGEVKCENGTAKGFGCQNVDLLSFLPMSEIGGSQSSGVWAWIDSATSREFAIVGRANGTAFIEVTDPTKPKYLGDLSVPENGAPAIWRDMKVYKNHAFIVTEGGGGMQVFDLTQLRDLKTAPTTFQETAHYDSVVSVHTIISNEETGFMYAAGSNGGGETCGGGLHMIDVRTPTKPVFAGCYAETKTGRAGTGYIHDAQCLVYQGPDADYKGKEICLNSAETALSIANVTDKKNPKTISIATYPSVGYTHQGWFTKDQRYFFIDDELDDGANDSAKTRTIVFDLNDLDDPVVLTEFYGATPATDHNLYIRGDLMYQSDYTAGLRVADVSDPKHPKEVGFFDTYPPNDNAGFEGGTWSNYPYFKNGVVAVTSMAEGIFFVRYRDAKPTKGR